jgi:hypothetical protein
VFPFAYPDELCRDDGCLFKRGASYLFEDYGHFSRYGSRIAVDGLLRAARTRQDE